MQCPRCETASLTELDRDGVTIDRCDRCRGVWLDRGELDKIIERYDEFGLGDGRRGDRMVFREHHHPRRKSFWQEFFD